MGLIFSPFSLRKKYAKSFGKQKNYIYICVIITQILLKLKYNESLKQQK